MALTLLTNLSYNTFLTTLLSTAFVTLLKPAGTFISLSIYVLSTAVSKPNKSEFTFRLDVSTTVSLFKIAFVE